MIKEVKKEHITFVLFGGTGDLTRRKLVPAFAKLIQEGILEKGSSIIGISRKEMSDKEYKEFLVSGVRNDKEKKHIRALKIKYVSGDFTSKEGLKKLRPLIGTCEPGKKCSRIYYLSTSFKFFPRIVNELELYGLEDKSGGFTRVAFEKPFGSDIKSAMLLEKEIHKVFSEEQIYRIDHYLGKETVQNLNVLKFTNPIFSSTFNNKFVEKIEIIVDEDLGVGNRLGYYNDAGAVKDMIQSHLLQMLALTLMNVPDKITPKNIHKEKIKILKNLRFVDREKNLFGQYSSYGKELKKASFKDKGTETFARVFLECKTANWRGVKLILRTGKKLRRKHGEVMIKFRKDNMMKENFEGVSSNRVRIGLYPTQDINLVLNTKDPSGPRNVSTVNFEFCHECKFGPNTSDGYSSLLKDIIFGDQTLFTSREEVEASWKVVEQILKHKDKISFKIYKDGTNP